VKTCERCGASVEDDGDCVKFAIWVKGEGWLTDSSGSAETSDRLRDACWFDDELEADAAVQNCELDRDEFVLVQL